MEKTYKVTAIVDGVVREVEMTENTLWKAWRLQEEIYGLADLDDFLDSNSDKYSPEELEVLSDPGARKNIVYMYHDYLCADWMVHMDFAVGDYLFRHKKEA